MSIPGSISSSPQPIDQGSIEPAKTDTASIVNHIKFSPAPADIPSRSSTSTASHQDPNPVPASNVAEETTFAPPPENDEESMNFATGTMITNDDDDDSMDLAEGSMIVNEVEDEDDSDDESMSLASGTMIDNNDNENDDMDLADGTMVAKDAKPEAKEHSNAAQKKPYVPAFQARMQEGLAELSGEEHLSKNANAALAGLNKRIENRNNRLNNPQGHVELKDKWVMENETAFTQHQELTTNGQIVQHIQTRREALSARKEELRDLVQQEKNRPLDNECADLYKNVATSTETIRPASGGQGGAYFGKGVIVKPKGESALEMNNRKGYAAVTTTSRVRDAIPLYQENEREAASYEMAKSLGLGHRTPPTVMEIISHSSFADITDNLEPSLKEKITNGAGGPDNEKVVTLQKMISGGTSLMDLWDTLEQQSIEKKAVSHPGEPHTNKDFNNFLRESIEPKSFEEASIACMFLGENDGNLGNFLAVQQPDGKYELHKIDNGLALPTRNEGFLNDLTQPSMSKDPISPEGRAIILNADASKLVQIAEKYGLDDTIEATTERIQTMQKIVTSYPDISIRELGYRLSLLDQPNGAEKAMGPLTAEDQQEGRISNPARMVLPQTQPETRATQAATPQRNTNENLDNAPRLDANTTIKPLWQRKLEFEQAAKQRAVENQEKPLEVIQKGRITSLIKMFNK